jgi:hypothetical protein
LAHQILVGIFFQGAPKKRSSGVCPIAIEGSVGKIPPPNMASPPLGISNIELLPKFTSENDFTRSKYTTDAYSFCSNLYK